MRISELLNNLFDIVFRLFPHRAPTGLDRLGQPGPDDPVLLTGNYTLTVRRMKKALRENNAWLLIANSNGINVWCAAGGGHLTHHDVISVLRTSRIGNFVNHRELILPQLGATGIEGRKVTAATGWETKWGPARLEDIPAYLHRGMAAQQQERFMRFPLPERLEMALIWILPILFLGLPAAYLIGQWPLLISLGFVLPAIILALFAILPKFTLHGITKWALFAIFAITGFLTTVLFLRLTASLTLIRTYASGIIILISTAILAIDLEGTTPWYGSAINTFRNQAFIDLDEGRCTGEEDCVLVCPKDVFTMDEVMQRVQIIQPEECIQCGACIVQCPADALRFRYSNGEIVLPETIRNTRMNLVARRTIQISPREEK